MASLTIRKLDETIKAYLRLRSARNGRSVKRRSGDPGEPLQGRAESSQHHRKVRLAGCRGPVPCTGTPIRPISSASPDIGGGIAAYKALDLIRRLKGGTFMSAGVLTARRAAVRTPLAASALSNERCYTDLFDPASEFGLPAISVSPATAT